MPFENFYKDTDKTDRRWRWLVWSGLLASGVYIIVLVLVSRYEALEAATIAPEFPVPARERKERVHDLCDSLPVPEDFQFVGKSNTTDTDRFSSVGYIYQSARSTDEIYPTFILWFSENGWTAAKTFDEGLQFSKNVQTVQIAPYAPFAGKSFDHFMVICTEGKYD